jgi:DNA-damage-inducible protein J
MTISDAVNIFIHQSLLSEGLPFPLKLPKSNATTLAAMEEIEDLINKKTSSTPQSVDEFFKDVELDANR